jgi:Rrf2 family protein
MDILRRNTDYALRAIVSLGKHWRQELVSTSEVAKEQAIPYQLACKIFQKLSKAQLVESSMGPKGGFQLSRKPAKINLQQVIEAMQGPMSLNRCLLDTDTCPNRTDCPVSKSLGGLQKYMNSYFQSVTVDDLLNNKHKKRGRKND